MANVFEIPMNGLLTEDWRVMFLWINYCRVIIDLSSSSKLRYFYWFWQIMGKKTYGRTSALYSYHEMEINYRDQSSKNIFWLKEVLKIAQIKRPNCGIINVRWNVGHMTSQAPFDSRIGYRSFGPRCKFRNKALSNLVSADFLEGLIYKEFSVFGRSRMWKM